MVTLEDATVCFMWVFFFFFSLFTFLLFSYQRRKNKLCEEPFQSITFVPYIFSKWFQILSYIVYFNRSVYMYAYVFETLFWMNRHGQSEGESFQWLCNPPFIDSDWSLYYMNSIWMYHDLNAMLIHIDYSSSRDVTFLPFPPSRVGIWNFHTYAPHIS